MDNVPHVIVGVTPPSFFGLEVGRRVDVTVPIDGAQFRQGWLSMDVLARLRTDISPAASACHACRHLPRALVQSPRGATKITEAAAGRAADDCAWSHVRSPSVRPPLLL